LNDPIIFDFSFFLFAGLSEVEGSIGIVKVAAFDFSFVIEVDADGGRVFCLGFEEEAKISSIEVTVSWVAAAFV